MEYRIAFDHEEDGRWIAEIHALPGVLVYGSSKEDAKVRVEALALRVIADQIERDCTTPSHIGFASA